MRKKDELVMPNSCIAKALDDEMMFVLLSRDPSAPYAIRMWVRDRVRRGMNQPHDPKIREALNCADAMEAECPHGTSPIHLYIRTSADGVSLPICESCSVCGELTALICADCRVVNSVNPYIHVCTSLKCHRKHAAICTGRMQTV